MYLAYTIIHGRKHFFLRESYRDHDVLCHRNLFDLGVDPSRYIIYPGGNAFYIDECIEERLKELGIADAEREIENLLMPFVRPDLLSKLADFSRRSGKITKSPVTASEKKAIDDLHIFDKRRQYFLRYGNIDQSRIYGAPDKLFRVLLNKSRDEMEQYFHDQERIIEPADYKEYVYAIFNLQHHFTEIIARYHPQGLDPNVMDKVFLEEVCKLDTDSTFWSGFNRSDALPQYLSRYVIMFFDYGFRASGAWNEYIRQFMDGRRKFRWPETKKREALAQAATLFGVSHEKLIKMNKRELSRLFRKKAHELHPDKGGEQDDFVQLTELYRFLLKMKK